MTRGEGQPLALREVLPLLLAWGAALALLWPPEALARPLVGACRTAAVWTPFVALAGAPHAGGARRWPLLVGAALPAVVLALLLDRAQGLGEPRLLAAGVAGLLFCALLGEAATRAARSGGGLHGWLWGLLVPLPPVAAAALAWGAGAPLTGDGLPVRLWRLSPVGSLWAEVRPGVEGAAEGLAGAVALPGLSVALALLVVALWLEVRARSAA